MPLHIPIASVERETGLGKDTLRVWERRYGFPQPQRDANGERLYPPEQVEHLRLIKRLMDQGHRPGRLFSLKLEERLALADARAPKPPGTQPEAPALIAQTLTLLKSHDSQALAQALKQALSRQGLRHFVLDTVLPLNRAVGDAWMRGELEIFAEHLFSEQLSALLRQAISRLPARTSGPPRILLSTVPEELHGLGLLLAESLFSLDHAHCLSLGTQTPLFDMQRAAEAHQADLVVLFFSTAFPLRTIAPLLTQLRAMLPASIGLWAGGAISERLAAIDGVLFLPRLEDALAALQHWRSQHLG